MYCVRAANTLGRIVVTYTTLHTDYYYNLYVNSITKSSICVLSISYNISRDRINYASYGSVHIYTYCTGNYIQFIIHISYRYISIILYVSHVFVSDRVPRDDEIRLSLYT